jgi:hypothetical protein
MPTRLLLTFVLIPICVGCGGSATSTPAPTPASSAGTDAQQHVIATRDRTLLRRQGFSVDTTVIQSLADGSTLYVLHSICAGSADGHCQAVHAFRGDAPNVVWHSQYIGVRALRAVPNGFSVTAASYAAQDPLCCPSLPDVTDLYAWNGSGFDERGPLPHSPGS